jgi:quinol monooxygenase YgiN
MADLIVIARARAQAGRANEMEAALQTNAAASRGEAGCLSYSVLRGTPDGDLFMTFERWRSKADFDGHMATPHVQTLLQTIGPMLAAPPEILTLTEV